jgi:outer membrane protein TolC
MEFPSRSRDERGDFSVKGRRLLAITAALAAVSPLSAHGQISLYTTVDQALRSSTSVRSATADVQRAVASLSEAKDVFVPNFVVGSSVGPPSYGFPLGQPSIVTVQTQSLIFTFSQMDYVRAARAGVESAKLALADARQQVILDASLDYIQLDYDSRAMGVLDEENGAASRLAIIEQQRLDAEVGTREDVLRARLVSAQLRLKRLHVQDDVDMLRQRLSHLTGLPTESFVSIPASIPAMPDLGGESSYSPVLTMTSMNAAGVRSAYANALSHRYQAFGDSRQNYRPQIAFGAEYSRFAEFNNYQEYYLHFQHNNFGAGLQIKFPLFDASAKAKGRESVAEAAHATAQADQARDQNSENIMLLEKNLAELGAQKEIAEIQSELAKAQLEAVLTQLNSAVATPGGTPLTPREEQQARIEERRRYQEMLDANFEVTKTELSLLRATGGIEGWFKASSQP